MDKFKDRNKMNNFKIYRLMEGEKKEIISVIKNGLERHDEIIFAYIFGSSIDPEMDFFRDIDIGVYVFEDIVSPKQFVDYGINLSIEIERLLKKFPVDVVIMNDPPLSLAFRITQGMLLFTKNEDVWMDYIIRTWSLYHDHSITSRNTLKEILSA